METQKARCFLMYEKVFGGEQSWPDRDTSLVFAGETKPQKNLG
jgi:hypothetical protein